MQIQTVRAVLLQTPILTRKNSQTLLRHCLCRYVPIMLYCPKGYLPTTQSNILYGITVCFHFVPNRFSWPKWYDGNCALQSKQSSKQKKAGGDATSKEGTTVSSADAAETSLKGIVSQRIKTDICTWYRVSHQGFPRRLHTSYPVCERHKFCCIILRNIRWVTFGGISVLSAGDDALQ